MQMKCIFIMIFLFSSCSRFSSITRDPSSQADAKSCLKILNQIRHLSDSTKASKVPTESRAILWDWLQQQSQIDVVDAYNDLLKMNLSSEESIIITKALASGELQTDRFNYILWASGQLPKRRARAFRELGEWQNVEKTVELKKFLKSRKKFDQWEEKKFKKLLDEAGDDANAPLLKAQAKKQRESYERLKYACSAKVPNSDNANAGKNFRRFIMTVGPLSVVAGYTVANWSELQNAIREMQEGEGAPLKGWFKQLGYDLSIGLILNYTLGRIFSEPTGTYFNKVAKGYGADLVLGVADMFAYNIIFPKDNNEIEKRFNELKSDPNFESQMQLLQKQLDNIGFVVKFKSTVMDMVRKAIGSGQAMSFPEFGLLNLTVADLERPEVQKLVMKAIAAQLYHEGRYGAETPEWPKDIIETGEGGADRLFFYAGVGPLYHSVNILIGTRIYQTICMGKNNLGKAFTQAAVMHTIWAFSYNLFEFPFRSEMIGQ